MAERTTIARPYADAAFEYARGAGAMPQWGEMLRLADEIAADPRMADALGSPKLSGEEKASLFLSVAGDRLTAEMRNFIRIVIDADRIGVLHEVRELYEARRDEAEGVAKAVVESAMPIDDTQFAGIVQALERRLGKRIEATVAINPALIGGARVVVGDTVIDGSVQGKLTAMAHALRA